MSKLFEGRETAHLSISLHPATPQEQADLIALKRDLELIQRKTGFTSTTGFTMYVLRLTAAKCRDRLNQFDGVNDAAETVAEAFEQAVLKTMPRR